MKKYAKYLVVPAMFAFGTVAMAKDKTLTCGVKDGAAEQQLVAATVTQEGADFQLAQDSALFSYEVSYVVADMRATLHLTDKRSGDQAKFTAEWAAPARNESGTMTLSLVTAENPAGEIQLICTCN